MKQVNTYRAMLHARCPVDDGWDYYEVEIVSETHVIYCEHITEALNRVRGMKATQEQLTREISNDLKDRNDYQALTCSVTLKGPHPHGVRAETRVE